MRTAQYYTFDINPVPTCKVPRKGDNLTFRYENYLKYLAKLKSLAKAKRLNLSPSFKVVFIIPHEDYHLDGEPHLTGKNALVKLVEALRQALLPDGDIGRVDASKYWGTKGKIIIKNITAEDFEYLRQIK